ncbi:similar to Saccharomyces cerevisiae YOR079C ATX2 Golgi membrane protein involved in manganese homeostasis [Maudiozyma barnettii]|uniref:Similar to Saccharomyces cerevisiae YOR079C ATX2 Golgi membrane protein involved in manganese homeostasis n=1 Tax=Maudiozyma barnettii TaxID=61262 RepID=A0A8H2VIY5_9SACH|nr:Mn(2+) transporter ATX2 [Kazachstania barnettii]CAB4256261.1 similar to Saccharomyces cerevisiae YOR079C ATX2 Golgi membrane protein involved in manganese homeostasis [Kazachstania barnettii]CAD1784870.1 similar to Saccharomyces cerevisiae YOR079C ATX2 Golgi membrane protein involved in manganese homeostasis [Kazachstania barnettii]
MGANMLQVLLMALALLVLTFAIGSLPIYWFSEESNGTNEEFTGKSKHVQYINVLAQFGIGMLLGTSFMLVIPEGISECLEHGGNVGLNMLVGFLIVYVLDRIVQSIMNNNSQETNPGIEIRGRADIIFESWKDLVKNPKQVCQAILRNNVVFALFIHGLSDGVALGTAVNNDSLMVVMLIAIVIHKIPAVLSLSSLMISKQHLPKWEAISNLFAFALSTPLGYIVLSTFNLKHSETMSWLSGNLLLMSGGSLLYASFTAFVGDSGHSHNNEHIPMQTYDTEFSSVDDLVISQSDNHEDLDMEWDPRRFNIVNEDNLNSTSNGNPAPLESNRIRDDRGLNGTQQTFSWLSMDESIYTLTGVVLPVIISYVINE